MRFQWIEYGEAYYDIVESWMDKEAKRFTGCDEGWFDYVEYMMHDGISRPGENFWCKVILEKEVPFAVMVLVLADEKTLCVSEYVVAPEFRGKGLGTAALRELLCCGQEIIDREILSARAVIFPSNLASQRAFFKAGFRFTSAHPDGDAWYYQYRRNPNNSGATQIIKTHGITLYGSMNQYDIVLKPLSDDHLPFLYKWNSDPEVLYWSEGGEDTEQGYDEKTVQEIYGSVSQNALCFFVEVNDIPIGECWLQKMNLPYVREMYPAGIDVRRIDMMIGEKAYWSKGIGTAMIGMLAAYAFAGEGADVLHCFSDDYNIRSRRVWEKNGFTLACTEELPQPQKGKVQYHWRLTRREFISHRRFFVPMEKTFVLPLTALQPSQLYISEGKLRLCREWFDGTHLDPVPLKKCRGKYLMTDGHTRAVMAYFAGMNEIPCCLDEDKLDMAAYETALDWCEEEGITSIPLLARRVVSAKDYEVLWKKRCLNIENDFRYRVYRNKEKG